MILQGPIAQHIRATRVAGLVYVMFSINLYVDALAAEN